VICNKNKGNTSKAIMERKTVKTNNLNTGFYLLSIQIDGKLIKSEKIIIVR